MQEVIGLFAEGVKTIELPDSEEYVMPNVRWGQVECFFTPAYWAAQIWLAGDDHQLLNFRLTDNLCEEATACLLGGYGITEEMCAAAFQGLRSAGLISSENACARDIEDVLRRPLLVKGRPVRYRFPKTKAVYISDMLAALRLQPPEEDLPQEFRRWFLRRKGIGLKTASWITRNWLRTDEIAVVDIHIHRCGLQCGFFDRDMTPAKDYLEMEKRFIRFSRALSVDPSELDVLMWSQMRTATNPLWKKPVAA